MLKPISIALKNHWKLDGIPIFTDNWIWVLHTKGGAWAVDPGEAHSLIEWCKHHPESPLQGILVTHKHHDHIGGIAHLLEYAPELMIWAPAYHAWPFPHKPVYDNESIQIKTQDHHHTLDIDILHIPGHTLEHVAYSLAQLDVLFCGDTLFSMGCGKMFEGSPEQFWTSLTRLRNLPETHHVACTHEYTLSNARFAAAVEPTSLDIQRFYAHCQNLHEQHISTLPSTLKVERQLNPFLRCDTPAIQTAAETWAGHTISTPTDVFAALRSWKNNF